MLNMHINIKEIISSKFKYAEKTRNDGKKSTISMVFLKTFRLCFMINLTSHKNQMSRKYVNLRFPATIKYLH